MRQIDIYAVKLFFGDDIKTLVIKYGYEEGQYENVITVKNAINRHETFRIIVGHSGSPTDNHIEVLDALRHLKDENITICIILSYGVNNEYMIMLKNMPMKFLEIK